jgi:hypothetical protein
VSLVVLFTGARAIYDVRQEALRSPKSSERHRIRGAETPGL